MQTVPAPAKTPETDEVEVFLGAMVRAVDASLLEEWEHMREGGVPPASAPRAAGSTEETPDITRDERAFTVLVRNLMFQLVKAIAKRDWASAEQIVDAASEGPAKRSRRRSSRSSRSTTLFGVDRLRGPRRTRASRRRTAARGRWRRSSATRRTPRLGYRGRRRPRALAYRGAARGPGRADWHLRVRARMRDTSRGVSSGKPPRTSSRSTTPRCTPTPAAERTSRSACTSKASPRAGCAPSRQLHPRRRSRTRSARRRRHPPPR